MKQLSDYRPIIIGAMGGSGTRLLARFLIDIGIYMGKDLNESCDAEYFIGFYDRWVNLNANRSKEPIDYKEMLNDFCQAFASFLGDSDSEDIGWKNPRSIHMIDFFHAIFPQMRYIHVVRDGRDIAYSRTQLQVDRHALALLGDVVSMYSKPVVSALLWEFSNLFAKKYGEKNLKGQYYIIRYEDLCGSPEEVLRGAARFAGKKAPKSVLTSYSEMIENYVDENSTIRRYSGQDQFEIGVIESKIFKGLKEFNYV